MSCKKCDKRESFKFAERKIPFVYKGELFHYVDDWEKVPVDYCPWCGESVDAGNLPSRYEEIRDEAERDYYEEKPTGLVVLGRLVFNVSRLIEHYAYDCSLQSFPTRDFIRAVRFCELYAKDQGHEFTCETPTRSEENPLTTIPSDLQFVVQGFIEEDYDMVKIGLEGLMRVAN